jgi:hypothetical protein
VYICIAKLLFDHLSSLPPGMVRIKLMYKWTTF